jgi:hypothetical protein
MGRITVDVNEEWLDAAQELLGTQTKVATINEALRTFAVRKKAAEIAKIFASVEMDFSGSAEAWRYGGGRDLSRLAEDARRSLEEDARRHDVA